MKRVYLWKLSPYHTEYTIHYTSIIYCNVLNNSTSMVVSTHEMERVKFPKRCLRVWSWAFPANNNCWQRSKFTIDFEWKSCIQKKTLLVYITLENVVLPIRKAFKNSGILKKYLYVWKLYWNMENSHVWIWNNLSLSCLGIRNFVTSET